MKIALILLACFVLSACYNPIMETWWPEPKTVETAAEPKAAETTAGAAAEEAAAETV